MKHASLALWLFCALLVANAFAQDTVWVSSTDAPLKADKTASSKTIANLPAGTRLTVVSSENRWYRVKTASGDTGWIYRGKVTTEPPPKSEAKSQGDALGSLLGGLTGSSIQASASDTSRSIRGLSPEAKEYARASGTPETFQKALDEVLSLQVSNEEIEKLLRSEKIGEYAE